MMTRSCKLYRDFLSRYLDGMITLSNPRKNFFIKTLTLFLSIHGKINFLQLARYSNSCEQMYRKQFEKRFDFMTINSKIIQDICSQDIAIAFDPSYVQKSGKKTPGLGKYWSGCAQSAKWGLEFCGLAALDMEARTAFHIEAVQTIPSKETTLTQKYTEMITSRSVKLLGVSKYLVADAWFYKKYFCDEITKIGFNLVTRAKRNSAFRYFYFGENSGKQGRPKTYDGKVDISNLNFEHFSVVSELETETEKVYEAVVYSNALKRIVKLVVVKSKTKKKGFILYVSTDESLTAKRICDLYRTRFQIEFLYRDGKQFTGLNSCQSRSENKLHMHTNMSLTAINVAKAIHHMEEGKYKQEAFSMSDIKQRNYNNSILDLFLSSFEIKTKLKKNINIIRELGSYGCKSA